MCKVLYHTSHTRCGIALLVVMFLNMGDVTPISSPTVAGMNVWPYCTKVRRTYSTVHNHLTCALYTHASRPSSFPGPRYHTKVCLTPLPILRDYVQYDIPLSCTPSICAPHLPVRRPWTTYKPYAHHVLYRSCGKVVL